MSFIFSNISPWFSNNNNNNNNNFENAVYWMTWNFLWYQNINIIRIQREWLRGHWLFSSSHSFLSNFSILIILLHPYFEINSPMLYKFNTFELLYKGKKLWTDPWLMHQMHLPKVLETASSPPLSGRKCSNPDSIRVSTVNVFNQLIDLLIHYFKSNDPIMWIPSYRILMWINTTMIGCGAQQLLQPNQV